MLSRTHTLVGVPVLFLLITLSSERLRAEHSDDTVTHPVGVAQFDQYKNLTDLVRQQGGKDSGALVSAVEYLQKYRLWVRDCSTNGGDNSATEFGQLLDRFVEAANDADASKLSGLFTGIGQVLNEKKSLFSDDLENFSAMDDRLVTQSQLLLETLTKKNGLSKPNASDVSPLASSAINALRAMKNGHLKVCDLKKKDSREETSESNAVKPSITAEPIERIGSVIPPEVTPEVKKEKKAPLPFLPPMAFMNDAKDKAPELTLPKASEKDSAAPLILPEKPEKGKSPMIGMPEGGKGKGGFQTPSAQ